MATAADEIIVGQRGGAGSSGSTRRQWTAEWSRTTLETHGRRRLHRCRPQRQRPNRRRLHWHVDRKPQMVRKHPPTVSERAPDTVGWRRRGESGMFTTCPADHSTRRAQTARRRRSRTRRGGRVIRGQDRPIVIAGQPVEIAVSLSPTTVRITVRQLINGDSLPIPATGALVEGRQQPGRRRAGGRRPGAGAAISRCDSPRRRRRFTSRRTTAQLVQRLTLDAAAPGMSFLLPSGPLLGLGEGGVQFDARARPIRCATAR